eukprot:8484264-Pyramimonas_sp.AAC.1
MTSLSATPEMHACGPMGRSKGEDDVMEGDGLRRVGLASMSGASRRLVGGGRRRRGTAGGGDCR